ncbi:MAG: hypothetical protein M3120_02170 [Pseudomonadota bacterium]|nr:hypothetical protein [Pseudomonadota bacterium]
MLLGGHGDARAAPAVPGAVIEHRTGSALRIIDSNGQLDRQRLPRRVDDWTADLHGYIDYRHQLHRVSAEFELAFRDAGNIQQVIDQPHYLHQLMLPHRIRALDRAKVAAALTHELQTAAQRRPRIPQFVREHGQELVLTAVGLTPRLRGSLELLMQIRILDG